MGWNEVKGFEGVWLIKNFWGIGWGKNGYMWIIYGSNNIGYAVVWVDVRKFIFLILVNLELIFFILLVYLELIFFILLDILLFDLNCFLG